MNRNQNGVPLLPPSRLSQMMSYMDISFLQVGYYQLLSIAGMVKFTYQKIMNHQTFDKRT
jgi:hypothetical protein